MTQALQLLTVAIIGLGLACYALIIDRKEHKEDHLTQPDPRQPSLFPPTTAHREKDELVTR